MYKTHLYLILKRQNFSHFFDLDFFSSGLLISPHTHVGKVQHGYHRETGASSANTLGRPTSCDSKLSLDIPRRVHPQLRHKNQNKSRKQRGRGARTARGTKRKEILPEQLWPEMGGGGSTMLPEHVAAALLWSSATGGKPTLVQGRSVPGAVGTVRRP